MAQIEKLQGAFKKLVDFLFAGFLDAEESVEVEVGKTACSDASGKKLAQATGLDRAKPADLLEDDSPQGILKDARIEQPADFAARAPLNQDRAQEAECIPFE